MERQGTFTKSISLCSSACSSFRSDTWRSPYTPVIESYLTGSECGDDANSIRSDSSASTVVPRNKSFSKKQKQSEKQEHGDHPVFDPLDVEFGDSFDSGDEDEGNLVFGVL